MKIASVEFNNGISDLIDSYFKDEDIEITTYENFEELILADISGYDLILIDMSYYRCLELITYIKQTTNIPVVYLTQRYKKNIYESQIDDKEFVIHSYTREEFIQEAFKKIEAAKNSKVVDMGNVVLEEDNKVIKVNGNILELSNVEINICSVLIEKRFQNVTKQEIIEGLKRRNLTTTERAIREHIRKIRLKFSQAGVEPIETVIKVGYKWVY